MNDALNDLFRLESAARRFKAHFSEDPCRDPFRGCTIAQPEARRVRLAVQEIMELPFVLQNVVVACATDSAESYVDFDRAREERRVALKDRDDQMMCDAEEAMKVSFEPAEVLAFVLIMLVCVAWWAWPILQAVWRRL